MKTESIHVAPSSGFCFGVKRATDKLEERIGSKKDGERLFTLGKLIHNASYTEDLAARGVGVTSIDELDSLSDSATEKSSVTVFIRAHGITRETEEKLLSLSEKNPYFSFEDCNRNNRICRCSIRKYFGT